MDDYILHNCPGSSTGEDRTDRLSFEDCDDGNHITSQPFQQELQHGNLQVSQRSAFSPQNVLSATTSAQGFVENRLPINSNAHWLGHRSHPYLQGQSFQTSQPSAFSPPSELPARGLAQAVGEYQLPVVSNDDWHGISPENLVQEIKEFLSSCPLQSEFTATTIPLAFVRSQPPVYSNIDSGKEKPQLFQQEPQHRSFQTSHPPTFSPRRALSAPRFHEGFVGNQPAFIPTQKVLPSQADTDTAFASAATQHQYREHNQQQLNPQELDPQASDLRMQSRSSTAMNFPQIVQLLSTRSIPSKGCQPVESSLKHQLTLEEIQQLIKKFIDKREREKIPQKDVTLQLFNQFKEKLKTRFTEKSFIDWITRFKNFPVCFENMCHIKSLLECFMDDYQKPQSCIDSLPNTTAFNILGQETQAPIYTTNLQFPREVNLMQNPKSDGGQITMRTSNFGTDDSLSINRPDSSTGKVKAHMMPQERSSDSDKKRNDVGTCLHQEHQVSSTNEPYEEGKHVLNQMVPHCEVWTNERTVPSISTSNKNARHIVSYWKGVGTVSQSMYTPNLWFPHPPKAHPKEKTTLGEMIRFARSFNTWRRKQNLRQMDVSFQLLKLYEADIGFQLISDFEAFCGMYKDICEFAPVLEEWFQEIH